MKRVFFYLVVLTLCLTLVSATDTTVQVKTVPFKNIQMNVLQSGSTTVYDGKRFNKDSNEYGDATFTFSLDDPYFDLTIFVKDVTTGNKVAYEKLESQDAGDEIYVEVVPSNFEIIETPKPESEINETIVEEETINDSEILEQEEVSEENPTITGKAIFEDTKTLKTILYVIGVIVILGIIFFFSKKYFKSKKPKDSKDIKIKKLSELKEEKKEQTEEQKDKIDNYRDIIEDAQRKIKEAQDEINKLRNQDKIKEVEKRIEEEQKELQRLKGE